MKPEFHDQFVELNALYFSGEISDEEWALLQIHVAYCESCHEKFLQYQIVSSEVFPAMAAELAREHISPEQESADSVRVAEARLMRRLESLQLRLEPVRNKIFTGISPPLSLQPLG